MPANVCRFAMFGIWNRKAARLCTKVIKNELAPISTESPNSANLLLYGVFGQHTRWLRLKSVNAVSVDSQKVVELKHSEFTESKSCRCSWISSAETKSKITDAKSSRSKIRSQWANCLRFEVPANEFGISEVKSNRIEVRSAVHLQRIQSPVDRIQIQQVRNLFQWIQKSENAVQPRQWKLISRQRVLVTEK